MAPAWLLLPDAAVLPACLSCNLLLQELSCKQYTLVSFAAQAHTCLAAGALPAAIDATQKVQYTKSAVHKKCSTQEIVD